MEEITENPDTDSKRGQCRGEWFDEDWLDGIDEGDWLEDVGDSGKGIWFDEGDEKDQGDWAELGVEEDWVDGLEVPAEKEANEAVKAQEATTTAVAGADGEKEEHKNTCASYLVGGNWLEDPLGLFNERPALQTRPSQLEEEEEEEAASTLVKMQEGGSAAAWKAVEP